MGVFQDVSNWLSGSYKVRTTRLSDAAQLQHVRIDLGSGTSEAVASGALPVSVSNGGSGMKEPYHDEQVVDESAAPATTVITYKLAGVSVGTKTITVSGTTTTILVA